MLKRVVNRPAVFHINKTHLVDIYLFKVNKNEISATSMDVNLMALFVT